MKPRIVILLSSLIFLAAALYYVVPQEQYERYAQSVREEKTIVQEDTETNQEVLEPQISKSSEMPFLDGDLPTHLMYYYDTLSDEEKSLYKELYLIMVNHMDYTYIRTADSEKVGRLMEYILLDNPELFYIDSLKTQTITVGSSVSMAVMAEEIMPQNEQNAAKANLENYRNGCVLALTEDMSDYDKALAIYEYVVTNLKYIEDAPYNQSLYSAVLGESVCRGYACAFKYLCDEAGIPCIMVMGVMQGENHAWNMVYLDGAWCQVDCTAGDDLEEAGYAVDYSWFGGTDSYMQMTHTASEEVALPTADSMANSYYVREGRYFDSYNLEKLSALLKEGNDFSFQCANQAVYDQYQYEMSNSQDVAQSIEQGKNVQFMGNGNTYTIYVEFK